MYLRTFFGWTTLNNKLLNNYFSHKPINMIKLTSFCDNRLWEGNTQNAHLKAFGLEVHHEGFERGFGPKEFLSSILNSRSRSRVSDVIPLNLQQLTQS